MKKRFNIENLDCANCAAKMEAGIKELEGVEDAMVNFLTQKITLVAQEKDFEMLLPQIEKVCKKIDKNFVIHF